MKSRTRTKAVFTLVCLAALIAASLSAAEIVQKGTLRVNVTGKLSPQRLPRSSTAPIAVSVGWTVQTTDGSPPPKLNRLRVAINRHGHFDFSGLPLCKLAKIQPGSSGHALAACRSALVGRGSFTAQIALQGQEPYESRGRLLVFNGQRHGKNVLLGHIYSASPFAVSFVIVFALKTIPHGTYGTALSATLPPSLSTWGNLTGIQMTLSRHFSVGGRRHSYISAACPTPKGFGSASFDLARTLFNFSDGRALSTTVGGTCKVRRP